MISYRKAPGAFRTYYVAVDGETVGLIQGSAPNRYGTIWSGRGRREDGENVEIANCLRRSDAGERLVAELRR